MKPLRVPGPRLVVPGERSPKVAIGYPSGGNFTGPFMESLLGLREYDLLRMQNGLDALVYQRLPQAGLYVDHNRNRIAEKFFNETECDWLLQIDSDVEFPPTIVETLLDIAGHDKKVLAASVPLGPPFPSCAFVRMESPGVWGSLPAQRLSPDGIEVEGLATAMLIVHRSVFEAIADQEGQCWFLQLPPISRFNDAKSAAAWGPDGRIRERRYIPQGEDLSFSTRAQAAGFKLWCAMIPGLRHHKRLPLSHDLDVPLPVPRAGITDVPVPQEEAAQ